MLRRLVIVVAATAGALACSSKMTSPTPLPPIAGTYNVSFLTTATCSSVCGASPVFHQTMQSAMGSITLSAADAEGLFTGTFNIQGGANGTLQGTEQLLQGTGEYEGGVQVTQFGNPTLGPFGELGFLQPILPECDFADTLGSNGNGNVVQGTVRQDSLYLTGGLVFQCVWVATGEIADDTLTTATTQPGNGILDTLPTFFSTTAIGLR